MIQICLYSLLVWYFFIVLLPIFKLSYIPISYTLLLLNRPIFYYLIYRLIYSVGLLAYYILFSLSYYLNYFLPTAIFSRNTLLYYYFLWFLLHLLFYIWSPRPPSPRPSPSLSISIRILFYDPFILHFYLQLLYFIIYHQIYILSFLYPISRPPRGPGAPRLNSFEILIYLHLQNRLLFLQDLFLLYLKNYSTT